MTALNTSALKNDIKLLTELNPLKESLGVLKDGHLKKTHRSAFRNFFRWLIHKITCSKTPLNPDLDKVTRQILSNSQAYTKAHSSSNSEKALYVTAIQNLQIVCQKNGGSLSNQVAQMLLAAKKIEIFVAKAPAKGDEKQTNLKKNKEEKPSSDTLNDSKKNEEQPQNQNKNLKSEIPVPVVAVPDKQKAATYENPIKVQPPATPVEEKAKTHENPLQNFLVSCENERYYSTSKTDQFCALLEKLEHCDGLSDKHIEMLNALLRNIQFMNERTGRPSWIEANAKKIKPDLLKFLIDNTSDEESTFISRLYTSLISEPVNPANLEAFVKGFKHTNRFKHSLILSFNKAIFELFKQHLSADLLGVFLKNLFSDIGYLAMDKVLDIIDNFDGDYQTIALEALCHSSEEASFLIYNRYPKDSILKLILDLNPCKEDDEFDLWFINFMEKVGIESIYSYILKNGTEARKITLLKECTPDFLQNLLNNNPKDPQSNEDPFFDLVLQAYPYRISDYIMSQECQERKNRYLLHCSGSTEILKYFEQVPPGILEQFSAENLILIAKDIAYKEHEKQNEFLLKLCKAIETKINPTYETFEPYLNCVISPETTFGILFPYFSPEYQCKILFADGKISSAADSLSRKIFPGNDFVVESEKAKIYAPIVESILKNQTVTKELLKKREFILGKLFLHFSEELQTKILNFALTNSYSLYLEGFSQVSPKVWENASREIKEKISTHNSIFKKGTIEQRTSFINCRTKDNFDLDDFFLNLFNEGIIKKEVDDPIMVETQKRSLAYLNPSLFEKLKDDIKTEVWEKLLLTLSVSPVDEHHQSIFLAAVEKMLKSVHIKTYWRVEKISDYINKFLNRDELTLSLETISSRPLRLLLAVLGHNLKLQKHHDDMQNTANEIGQKEYDLIQKTANEMSQKETDDFNLFLISIHSERDIIYFCRFFRLLDTLEFKPEFVEKCISYALNVAVRGIDKQNSLIYSQREDLFHHLPTIAWNYVLEKKLYDENELTLIADCLPFQLARKFVSQNEQQIYNKSLSTYQKVASDQYSRNLFKLSDDGGFIFAALKFHIGIHSSYVEDFFKIFPWKLLLRSGPESLKSRIIASITLPELPEEDFGNIGQELANFIEAADGDDLYDALLRYKKLPNPIKELFLIPLKKATRESIDIFRLVDIVKHINYGQFLAMLMDPEANQRIVETGSHSVDLINFAIKLRDQLKEKNIDVSLIERFLNTPIESERSKKINDDFADIEFKLAHEHIKLHKALLTLVPELKEYAYKNGPIIIPDREIKKIKSLIDKLYGNYKFSDIPSKRFEMQSSAAISFSTLYDNPAAFPDFTIFTISKKETKDEISEEKTKNEILEKETKEIVVHRTILNVIPYFQRLFSGNYIENKQITFDDEKLKTSGISVKAIIAAIGFVYGAVHLDQINDKDTEEAINTALGFLGFNLT